MLTQFFTVGLLTLFSAMLPGPDFALVTRNTISYSRRAGLFTSLGVVSAIGVHMLYCVLGLALIISKSLFLFGAIKYLGAVYLLYLGVQTLMAKHSGSGYSLNLSGASEERAIASATAFWQGFLCNLLNPKATLFFLAMFTVVIKPETSQWWAVLFAIEIMLIACLWFCSLTLLLSHPRVIGLLAKVERLIEKLVGLLLVGFGFALIFLKS